jgi:hypothetical protein
VGHVGRRTDSPGATLSVTAGAPITGRRTVCGRRLDTIRFHPPGIRQTPNIRLIYRLEFADIRRRGRLSHSLEIETKTRPQQAIAFMVSLRHPGAADQFESA